MGLCIPSVAIFYLAFVHGEARYDRIPDDEVIVVVGSSSQRPAKAPLKEVLTSVEVWTLAIFLFFYVG